MDKEIVLVLGGARSGKSSWALRYVEKRYTSLTFLATAEVRDDEMAERIRRHRASRDSRWHVVEEPLDIDNILLAHRTPGGATLIDCLTVWLSNVLLKKGRDAVAAYQHRLLEALAQTEQAVVLVANEVGSGIVPEHPLGREFRDLAGILNQKVAELSDRVVLIVAGIPLYIK